MSKENDLKKDLLGVKKKTLKKPVSDIKENEKITKNVYKPKSHKSKKTTIDLPEDIHMKAKIVAMEEKTSLKDYILDLVLDDLGKRGKV